MLLTSVFLLFSCKTELGDTESTRNTSQATGASKISFRDFTKTTGTSLDKIQKISEAINLEPNKGMKSSLAEFNIDTAYVKKLIYGNNETSFTIKAYKNNENPFNIFYNIVYHKVDDQWKAEVFKYTYAKEWLENYNANPKIPFSGNIQYIKTANLDISAGRIYTCAYTVQTLCYCADHTPGQCKGCSAGFRDVAVLDCSEEQTGGGTTISGNPSLGAPPYNDPPMGGGLGTSSSNPYTNGFQYDPSMPEFDEVAFRENNIRYQTWETFGSDWIQLHSDLYYKIEAYQVAKKSVDFGFSTNLVYNYPNEFVNWAFDFLLQNTMTSQAQFQNWFLTDIPSNFLQQVVLENPATILNYESLSSPSFKMRKIDQLKYPKFTTIIKNLKTEIQNNPTTLNRLVQLTGLTESQVLGSLTFGQGPTIKLIPNLMGPSGPNYGNFDHTNPTYINVNLDFVLGLEQASLSTTRHATAFLLAVTVLHEFIHFGNYISGYDPNGNEMGNLFEISTYGIIVTHLNAGNYIIQLK